VIEHTGLTAVSSQAEHSCHQAASSMLTEITVSNNEQADNLQCAKTNFPSYQGRKLIAAYED